MEEILHQLICIYTVYVCIHIQNNSVNTLSETNSSPPENQWLEDDPFPFGAGRPIFRGALLLVSGSVQDGAPSYKWILSLVIPIYKHG